jgi:hypothetical protein
MPLTRGSMEPASAHAPGCPSRIGADSPRPHMQLVGDLPTALQGSTVRVAATLAG